MSGRSTRAARSGEGRELTILYQDEAIVVVDKPAGLLTVPLARRERAPSVASLIETRFRSHRARRVFPVHRLDRDTSGLVVFARNARAQEALKQQFIRHEPERVYRAVVHGHPAPAAGIWRDRLMWDQKALVQKAVDARDAKGTDAISEYRVLESLSRTSIIEVRLRTGKRNQIRIQASLRGHPLVGERQYARGEGRPIVAFPRQALHAYRLAFRHPVDGRPLSFEAPLPHDLAELIASLRKNRRV